LLSSDFILDVENGYKIPLLFLFRKNIYNRYNKSALLEDKFVAQAIKDLLDRNLVEKCSKSSFCS